MCACMVFDQAITARGSSVDVVSVNALTWTGRDHPARLESWTHLENELKSLL